VLIFISRTLLGGETTFL